MSSTLAPIFKKAYASLAALGGLYLLFVFALTFPTIQRHALYAHYVNPSHWQNLSDFESFGFHPHQVHPFTVRTPDNETLYAWHILPTHLVQAHAKELAHQQHQGDSEDPQPASLGLLATLPFQLLADPTAHVILNFHGNAAHLGSAYRPSSYRSFLGLSSPARPVHVIAFDYRGFGKSTGHPTEAGLLTDAETMLTFLTGLTPSLPSNKSQSTLSISPAHISLTSQSLGTAVATALYHSWFVSAHLPPPALLLLTSPFSSFASLIDVYSIKGLIPPLLSPFRGHPALMRLITRHIADPWRTDLRLREIMHLRNPRTSTSPVRIEIFHAHDDREIPWWEGVKLWDSVVEALSPTKPQAVKGVVDISFRPKGEQGEIQPAPFQRQLTYTPDSSTKDGSVPVERVLRFSCLASGGHNQIAASEEVAAAVERALKEVEEREKEQR